MVHLFRIFNVIIIIRFLFQILPVLVINLFFIITVQHILTYKY